MESLFSVRTNWWCNGH